MVGDCCLIQILIYDVIVMRLKNNGILKFKFSIPLKFSLTVRICTVFKHLNSKIPLKTDKNFLINKF